MANKLLKLPMNRLFNNSNVAAPGGTAQLYLSGTSTAANFLDGSGTSLGPTLTANGLGQLPSAYGDENTAYRLVLKDRTGAQLDGGDIDPFYFGAGEVPTGTVAISSLEDIATNKLLGRATAGTGPVEQIDCTAFARTILDDADAAAVRATIGAAPARLTVETEAGATYALVTADAGKHKRFTNAAAVVTVSADELSVGDRVRITDVGGGLTLVADTGVTLNSRDSALTSAGAFAVLEVECVGTNVFDVLGDVTA